MTLRVGATLTLDIERPAVGGRMLGRHDGRVVFVAGAIPGERVEARVERVQRQVIWATTTAVVVASPDRVEVPDGLTCGGQVLAHVHDDRQRLLKAEMLADALRRIGKLSIDGPIAVRGGPADGYRIRARVHVRGGRAGFFDEGSHHLCALAPARQLTPASVEAIDQLTAGVVGVATAVDAELEWAEDVAGERRIAHVTVGEPRHLRALQKLRPVPGISGLSLSVVGDGRLPPLLWGDSQVIDRLQSGGAPFTVGHSARAFFQGNRYLLQPLVDEVIGQAGGSVLDLYAGVGLFTLAAAAAGRPVTAVEGDPVSAADLAANVAGRSDIAAVHAPVEDYLASATAAVDTAIVDPPRTGLSAAAMHGLLALTPARIIYVSCDPATLARDLRRCLGAGYSLGAIHGFDLFPRTGHVEAVAVLNR
jgi:23S rRNA (uracil1939-C5)-methyltransferase